MDVSPGCFSLRDLVNPDFSPIPTTPLSGTDTPKRSGGIFRRQSSIPVKYGTDPNLRSLVDDRNDEPWSVERKVLFTEMYVLTRQVNKGRVSNIWECVHRTTGVRYAAKIIDRRQLKSRDDDLVYQEVNVLTDIRGSGVGLSKLVDFFDEESHFYIILDFADGGDFLTTLVKKEKLEEDEAKQMAKSLLQALHYLHKNNICHRNLKPENILLKNERDMGSVVIADFGMATRILTDADGDMLKLTDRCGTAAYMAPEVIVQVPYDTQADMWTLGVIMYNVLAGKLPFEDPSRRAVYQKVVKCDYIFHPNDWLGISKSAKRFISNLIHSDADVRMTAEEGLEHPWLADLVPKPTLIVSPKVARSPQQSERKSSHSSSKKAGKKFKGSFWKAMTGKKSSGLDEIENMDDSRSTSSQTASNVSSDITNDNKEHRRWLEK